MDVREDPFRQIADKIARMRMDSGKTGWEGDTPRTRDFSLALPD